MGNTFTVPTTENPMPWRTLTVNQQRQEFLALAQKPSRNLSELCRRFGISRKTAYKWLARGTTEDQSRRPKNSPKRSNATLEAQVLAVRDAHPAWGGRKIAHVLMRDQQLAIAPSTVTSILHRLNRPKIIGGRMDWIRQLCLIRLFGDSTPLQILLAECSRWNSAVGAG